MKHPYQVEIMNEKTGRISVLTVYEEGSSMTNQQWKDDCDINLIMKKFAATGENPHKNLKLGAYADMANIPDYQGMLDTVIFAQEAFMTLPAEARYRFQNNPAELISFLQDPSNHDEGVKLGLIQPKPDLSQSTPDLQNQNQIQNQNLKSKTKSQSQPKPDLSQPKPDSSES